VGEVAEGKHDLGNLVVITRVNGEERQRANTNEMVFSIPMLLSYVSHVMTLEPGDLVATGTPAGVGPLKAGDVVEIEIEGVSRVSNPVTGPV
ncbi:MAG TPA: fumarylacetoacetate hydrolase family protein, partial [Gemmatimonadaceae bacterium]|nr:fumarylacetoacetate hydrolase family protein [Gemmatimonadaceae bacterium]